MLLATSQPDHRQVRLLLPWPPTLNHNITAWRTLTAKHIKFRQDVRYLLLAQARGIQLRGRLRVDIVLAPPNKIRRDIDNLVKPILDALQHGGLYEDDEQIDQLSVCRIYGGDPGAVVNVSELER